MGKSGKGKFFALEGGDGTGKSTQTRMLTDRLQENGIPAIRVQEPGTTPLGLHLRAFLKGDGRISPEAEMLLFGAGRAQLTNAIIRPSLEQGITVVADRFEASSVAYQGYGRGLPLKNVESINAFATEGIHPDLNILLDLDPEMGLGRTGRLQPGAEMKLEETGIRLDPAGTRRFEEQPVGFHQRVRSGYLVQTRNGATRWAVIDATLPQERVHELVWQRVMEIMEQ